MRHFLSWLITALLLGNLMCGSGHTLSATDQSLVLSEEVAPPPLFTIAPGIEDSPPQNLSSMTEEEVTTSEILRTPEVSPRHAGGRSAPPSPRPVRILSCDGGGMRGTVSTVILIHLQEELNRKGLNAPLHEAFDVCAGVSTGALLIAMLNYHNPKTGKPYAPLDALHFYQTYGPQIFKKKPWYKRMVSMNSPKYPRRPFEKILFEHFGFQKLSDLPPHRNVIFIAYDTEKRAPHIFSSLRARRPVFTPPQTSDPEALAEYQLIHQRLQEQAARNDFFLVDILAATTAAPTYRGISRVYDIFAHEHIHRLRHGDQASTVSLVRYTEDDFQALNPAERPGWEHAFSLIDGGVACNSPGLCALTEAHLLYHDTPLTDYTLFSVGTGHGRQIHDPSSLRSAGALTLIPLLSNESIDAATSTTTHILNSLFCCGAPFSTDARYVHIQPSLPANLLEMDKASVHHIEGWKSAAESIIEDKRSIFEAITERLVAATRIIKTIASDMEGECADMQHITLGYPSSGSTPASPWSANAPSPKHSFSLSHPVERKVRICSLDGGGAQRGILIARIIQEIELKAARMERAAEAGGSSHLRPVRFHQLFDVYAGTEIGAFITLYLLVRDPLHPSRPKHSISDLLQILEHQSERFYKRRKGTFLYPLLGPRCKVGRLERFLHKIFGETTFHDLIERARVVIPVYDVWNAQMLLLSSETARQQVRKNFRLRDVALWSMSVPMCHPIIQRSNFIPAPYALEMHLLSHPQPTTAEHIASLKRPHFEHLQDVESALEGGSISLHTSIILTPLDPICLGELIAPCTQIVTTPGRLLLGTCLPQHPNLPFTLVNRPLSLIESEQVVTQIVHVLGEAAGAQFAGQVMEIRRSIKSSLSQEGIGFHPAEHRHYYCMSGSFFANNPTLLAFSEGYAMRSLGLDNFVIASLGTGEVHTPLWFEDIKDAGKLSWAGPIGSVMADGPGSITAKIAHQLFHNPNHAPRYYRFQPKITDADIHFYSTKRENAQKLLRCAEVYISEHQRDLDNLLSALQGDAFTEEDDISHYIERGGDTTCDAENFLCESKRTPPPPLLDATFSGVSPALPPPVSASAQRAAGLPVITSETVAVRITSPQGPINLGL